MLNKLLINQFQTGYFACLFQMITGLTVQSEKGIFLSLATYNLPLLMIYSWFIKKHIFGVVFKLFEKVSCQFALTFISIMEILSTPCDSLWFFLLFLPTKVYILLKKSWMQPHCVSFLISVSLLLNNWKYEKHGGTEGGLTKFKFYLLSLSS